MVFLHEHKTSASTVEKGAAKRAVSKFIRSLVCWESAPLEKTTMTVNKRMAVGIQPTCHFAEAQRKATPTMCTQRGKVT